MGFETKKEEREVVVVEENKFEIKLEQIDVYDAINVMNMVENWKSTVEKAQSYINNFETFKEETIKEAIRKGNEMIDGQRQMSEKALHTSQEALKIWQAPFETWAKKHPRHYEQVLNQRKEMLVRKNKEQKLSPQK